VTSSVSGTAVGAAVDGNRGSRWSTNRGMQNGDHYQVDFTGMVKLSKITLDNTQDGSGNDFPGAVSVFTSQDGVNFNTVSDATAQGAAGQMVLSFQQETMRAIRIQVTAATPSNWWSIGEIQTDCSL
jgi:hypothetical protein